MEQFLQPAVCFVVMDVLLNKSKKVAVFKSRSLVIDR